MKLILIIASLVLISCSQMQSSTIKNDRMPSSSVNNCSQIARDAAQAIAQLNEQKISSTRDFEEKADAEKGTFTYIFAVDNTNVNYKVVALKSEDQCSIVSVAQILVSLSMW